MNKKGFEGWYFKHQNGNDMIAFIPGRAQSGAFIQMISSSGSRQFDVPDLYVIDGTIYAGECRFSKRGCKISLPGVHGEITYGNMNPLSYDIMGPFRFLPMQCRHGVISMMHTLNGSLHVDGKKHSFNIGKGYIEKDSGISFPRSYLWTQCNDFSEPCSVMLSIAHIPFCAMSFMGCICAVMYKGQEYRLATYKGVRIIRFDSEHIQLSQGKLLFKIDIKPFDSGHVLSSPIKGKMCGRIRESCNADIRIRLWENKSLVFDLKSSRAAYEFVPDKS